MVRQAVPAASLTFFSSITIYRCRFFSPLMQAVISTQILLALTFSPTACKPLAQAAGHSSFNAHVKVKFSSFTSRGDFCWSWKGISNCYWACFSMLTAPPLLIWLKASLLQSVCATGYHEAKVVVRSLYLWLARIPISILLHPIPPQLYSLSPNHWTPSFSTSTFLNLNLHGFGEANLVLPAPTA